MKLNEIQKALKVPKAHTNTFANYTYRNAEDILEAVKPLLGDSILTLSDEMVQLGDRYYVKATAIFSDADEIKKPHGLSQVVTAYAREPLEKKGSDASQITGAASSYARKYALNGLFLIDDTKDADSDEGEPAKPPQTRQEPRTAKKPNKMEEDRTDIALADKKRIADYLKRLGVAYTKETIGSVIAQKTSLKLEPENVGEIISRLAALVAEKEYEA